MFTLWRERDGQAAVWERPGTPFSIVRGRDGWDLCETKPDRVVVLKTCPSLWEAQQAGDVRTRTWRGGKRSRKQGVKLQPGGFL